MGNWCCVGTRIGQNCLKTFSGATRQFSVSAASSIDVIALIERHTIQKWRWRRCKIVQKWPCGAEWRPLGSSDHIFCVTPWMPNAVLRRWKITCSLSYLAGKTSMNVFSCTMAHRHTLHWACVSGWIRSFWNVGWDDEKLKNGLQEVQISHPVTFSCGGWAKEEVYQAKPRTMEQLEDRIRSVITNAPHDFLQKTVDSIPGRLRKLVDAAGTYIEF